MLGHATKSMSPGMAAVHRRVTYKLYPNATQAAALERLHDLHRALYNSALQERADAWRLSKTSVGFAAQCKALTQVRRENPEYLAANAQSLQVTLKRLDLAFAAFFRRVRAGETRAENVATSFMTWYKKKWEDRSC